jgi:hypothetical protein
VVVNTKKIKYGISFLVPLIVIEFYLIYDFMGTSQNCNGDVPKMGDVMRYYDILLLFKGHCNKQRLKEVLHSRCHICEIIYLEAEHRN